MGVDVGLVAAGWDGWGACLAAGAGAGFAVGLSAGFAGDFGVGLTANFSGGLDGLTVGEGGADGGCAGAAAATFGKWLRISWVASALMAQEGLLTG